MKWNTIVVVKWNGKQLIQNTIDSGSAMKWYLKIKLIVEIPWNEITLIMTVKWNETQLTQDTIDSGSAMKWYF